MRSETVLVLLEQLLELLNNGKIEDAKTTLEQKIIALNKRRRTHSIRRRSTGTINLIHVPLRRKSISKAPPPPNQQSDVKIRASWNLSSSKKNRITPIIKLTEAQDKRGKIEKELIETESQYIRDIQILINVGYHNVQIIFNYSSKRYFRYLKIQSWNEK